MRNRGCGVPFHGWAGSVAYRPQPIFTENPSHHRWGGETSLIIRRTAWFPSPPKGDRVLGAPPSPDPQCARTEPDWAAPRWMPELQTVPNTRELDGTPSKPALAHHATNHGTADSQIFLGTSLASDVSSLISSWYSASAFTRHGSLGRAVSVMLRAQIKPVIMAWS